MTRRCPLGLLLVLGCSAPKVPGEGAELELHPLLDELCRDERVPGMAVAVYWDGAIRHNAVAGVRNAETGERRGCAARRPARFLRVELEAGHRGGPTLSELQALAENPY